MHIALLYGLTATPSNPWLTRSHAPCTNAARPQLTRLCLSGNKLSNDDILELCIMLSDPAAPRVRDLDLEQNTLLRWGCGARRRGADSRAACTMA